MIEKAKQANRYGMNSKLATAAKIREMLLSDEFLDALAKRISYKSGIWEPKVGDKVKVNCPGRIAHGKVGVIVEDDAAEYVVRVDSENLTSRNLKAKDLELIGAAQWIPKVGDKVRVNRLGRLSDGKIGVIVECDAGEYTVRIPGHNLTSRNLTADDLEPIEASQADHIADASEMVPLAIPDGWRELQNGEVRLKTDLFSYGGKWVPITTFDPDGSDFQKYDKSIHYRHIRKIETDKPEQVDPLIDEESFLKPEPGTVAEEKWSPRVGDWVRIKRCKSGCWVSGMDYLDGQIRQVEELTPDDQGIVVDSYWLCEDCIDPYPWEPREGEKVQVINVDRVYEVEGFDRITKMVFCVGRSHGIELRLLKPYIEPAADHIADADKMVPPAGYRLLDKSAKVEPRKAGDLFWSLTLGDWKALSAESEQDANRDDWPACRKIEQPAKNPETIARYDSEGRNVTELAGLWTEGDTQYREPTQADLANGPIEVEVCDDNTLETNWEKRQLYAILPIKCMFPYIVGTPQLEGFTQSWKHARVKVR